MYMVYLIGTMHICIQLQILIIVMKVIMNIGHFILQVNSQERANALSYIF